MILNVVYIDVVFRRFVDDFRRLANRLGLTCKENLHGIIFADSVIAST